jgi:enoyl-CoA hydratase
MAIHKSVDASGICILSLSRPEAMNALNNDTIDQLREVMEEIAQNHEIKGVVLTGEGQKAFVAGADIRELANLTEQEAYLLSGKGQKLFKFIEDFPKPVVAAVNGFALGGGCELAMACHIRIASKQTKFGQPEINLGLIPGYGGTQRLTQLVGRGKALELLLTADLIAAEEAKNIGLVNHVVDEAGDVVGMAVSILQKIVTKSPLAASGIIKAVNAGFDSEDKGYEAEARIFSACVNTNDFKEGTSAFLEKRKPVFKGN